MISTFSQHIRRCARVIQDRWRPLLTLTIWIALLCHVGIGYADGTDYLADAKPAVQGTFGQNSTFIYLVYLIEGIVGVAAYIKTKSPFALIGIPVVLIFTHYFFQVIGS